MLALIVVLAQVAIPPPRGYVNDFAGVLDATSVARMDAVIAEVRSATRGEIAVVTLPDIGGRPASEVAVRIGRQWGVGAAAEAGDPAKNLGVVGLLVPRKDHQPGRGDIFIGTGRGAEGFLTDAAVGRIRDAILPLLAQEQYGAGLSLAVDLIAQAFGQEFGVTLTTPEYVRPPPAARPSAPIPIGFIIIVVILLVILSRGRIFLLPFLLSGRGGGWGGGNPPCPALSTAPPMMPSAFPENAAGLARYCR